MGKKYWETDKEKTNLKNEFDDIDDSEDIEDAFLTRKYYDSIVRNCFFLMESYPKLSKLHKKDCRFAYLGGIIIALLFILFTAQLFISNIIISAVLWSLYGITAGFYFGSLIKKFFYRQKRLTTFSGTAVDVLKDISQELEVLNTLNGTLLEKIIDMRYSSMTQEDKKEDDEFFKKTSHIVEKVKKEIQEDQKRQK